MTDDRNPLFCCRLRDAVAQIEADPSGAAATWGSIARDYQGATASKDPVVEKALADQDLVAAKKILADWDGDRRPRTSEDREMMKKAMKAFRKRLKLTKLDHESRLGVGAMTRGEKSMVAGIVPPDAFAKGVWQELGRQKRLLSLGQGLFGLNE